MAGGTRSMTSPRRISAAIRSAVSGTMLLSRSRAGRRRRWAAKATSTARTSAPNAAPSTDATEPFAPPSVSSLPASARRPGAAAASSNIATVASATRWSSLPTIETACATDPVRAPNPAAWSTIPLLPCAKPARQPSAGGAGPARRAKNVSARPARYGYDIRRAGQRQHADCRGDFLMTGNCRLAASAEREAAMTETADSPAAETVLRQAGLPGEAAQSWLTGPPPLTGDFAADAAAGAKFWRGAADLLALLPAKPARSAAERAAGDLVADGARAARDSFLDRHVTTLYRHLTDDLTRFVRVDDLVYAAAALLPGIAPTRAAVRQEETLPLKDKTGIEIDQGILLARVLADPELGRHLCHAMLLPRPDTAERLAAFRAHGTVALGAATIERVGKAAIVHMRNPRFLNAEDDTTLDAIESAVDLAILDGRTEVAVLRGGTVDHARHRGKRVFSAGINLTHLYQGKIPYLWYLKRDLGVVNKIFRGVARS